MCFSNNNSCSSRCGDDDYVAVMAAIIRSCDNGGGCGCNNGCGCNGCGCNNCGGCGCNGCGW